MELSSSPGIVNAASLLVTGGAGFIGSNFIRYLFAQPQFQGRIVNLDKLTYAGNLASLEDITSDYVGSRYFFEHGDICDLESVERVFRQHGITIVVHFAAESHVDRSIAGPKAFIDTNINGTFSLLQAARQAWDGRSDVRFHHVSTDEVYGSLGATGSFSESTPYDPRSPYSASKAGSDHLVRAYYHTYGLPVTITNCSNNYGPYQFPEKLIPLIIQNAVQGKELPVYGDGANVRDWLYVTDHCEAVLSVLEHGKPGATYNIGGNSERTNMHVVTTICGILDEKLGLLSGGASRTSLVRFVRDRQGHDRRYAIDASKIRSEFGWSPSFSFEQGIRHTIDWYLGNKDWVASVINGSYREYYRTMYEERLHSNTKLT
jgi:dTDP-glucose 4,6-dehydratase